MLICLKAGIKDNSPTVVSPGEANANDGKLIDISNDNIDKVIVTLPRHGKKVLTNGLVK